MACYSVRVFEYVAQVSKSKCEKKAEMSQAKDRPFPCSMYKENFDKNTEKTRFKRLFPERTPSEGSPQGAGGPPKTELHCPPPLPHDSRGFDHRHRARVVLT